MKILHISDFHFRPDDRNLANQDRLIGKMLANIEPDIDFLFFTGDLVFRGDELTDFDKAYNTFLKRIAEKLNLSKTRAFFCPGNHDVDRSKVSIPIKNHIRSIENVDQLNKFIDDNKPDEFGLSCKPTENFLTFQKKFFEKITPEFGDTIAPLFTTHIRNFNGTSIGIVTINTAWCSSGDDDSGNLFYPKSELEKAVNKLNNAKVDWKILLLHHPLSDLKEFCKVDIEDFIYSEFHFMFSGHLHKREDFIRFMQNEGIFGSYSYAAFTKKEEGKIGYTIVDVDLETLEIELKKYIYDFDEQIFVQMPSINLFFPTSEEKKKQIRLFKILKKRLEELIEQANELSVNASSDVIEKRFVDLFVDPVLKYQPQVETPDTITSTSKIDFKTLYECKNFLIYGKDKTGKTSLLIKLQIDILKEFSHQSVIPIYINLQEYYEVPNKFDIQKIISKHLEHSYADTEQLLEKYKFKLLIDNFDPAKSELVKKLSNFITKFLKSTYVIVSDQTLAQSYKSLDLGIDGYKKLFIHDISRNEIRQLTKKWPSIPVEKRDQIVEKISEILEQHGMPFNFWTLSIFLWIFSGKRTINFNNNSELLELYIDDVLDRTSLAADPGNRFSYSNYKLLLGELAFTLLTGHGKNNYFMPYSDLVHFIDDFKTKNIRRVGHTSQILEHLLKRGILRKIEEDYVGFRLNGVFEYFLAYHFLENKKFFNDVLEDDTLFLAFKNEFEIYSGFPRSENENKELLERIYNKTKTAFDELNKRMEGDLDLKLGATFKQSESLDIMAPLSLVAKTDIVSPLSEDEKDYLLEDINPIRSGNVEVRQKKIYDVSIKRFEILERYLVINGKTFKNVDNLNDSKFVNEVFDFIIDSSCNLGFLLIEEMEQGIADSVTQDLKSDTPNKLIFQLISNFLPNVVQSFIHDTIGHINLEAIVKQKIELLKAESGLNQFRLFILYSLLLDIDLKKNKSKIDDLINLTKMGVIKYSILLKLFEFLLMKSYDDDVMIAYLKEKIRKVNISINPKISMKEFDKGFEKTKKILVLKRTTEKL